MRIFSSFIQTFIGALSLWSPVTYCGPLFFKPDLPDFYQHQKSGFDAANPFRQPLRAPDDPPVPLQPGYANGNWWEEANGSSVGWCCVTAFVNSFYFLDKRGAPGLFDHSNLGAAHKDKTWQQRFAYANEDFAIDFLGLQLNGDPDGTGTRTRTYGPTAIPKTVPEYLAKYGFGSDKLSYAEFFVDEKSSKVVKRTPTGTAETNFKTLFDVYYEELLRGEDVTFRIQFLTDAEQVEFAAFDGKLTNRTITDAEIERHGELLPRVHMLTAAEVDEMKVLARKFRDGKNTPEERRRLLTLLTKPKYVWWNFHSVTGAGLDEDKSQRKVWFADPDNTFRGKGWGFVYTGDDLLPVPKDPATDAAQRSRYYEEATLAADGRTFMTGPYADPDGAGPAKAAFITRIIAISPVPEPSVLLLVGLGLAGLLALRQSRPPASGARHEVRRRAPAGRDSETTG